MAKSISPKCSVCGNDQFATVDETIEDLLDAPDDTHIRCSDCKRVVTKEQIIEENSHIIIKVFRYHDLRHTSASVLMTEGIDGLSIDNLIENAFNLERVENVS